VKAIPVLETALKDKRLHAAERKVLSELFARPLGLDLRHFSRRILRHGKRSPFAKLSSSEVQNLVAARRLLKARGFFEAADAVRGMLTENGVEVMDGDPLGWDWRVG
jgi:cysteinyl-tRNA synthetase